jgi:hypothetical protein
MKFTDVRVCALSWPEVSEQPHFQFTSFRVRSKIFATAPPEQTHLHLFVSETVREQTLAMHPQWAHKLLWGSKVVGLRIELATAAPAVLKQLIGLAWTYKAPKALLQHRDANAERAAAEPSGKKVTPRPR